ncbi:MAG TPA: FimV/HubP family polar landmark protein [Bordetella sp.]|nr:FimV/HubP family polar landmark protein [Bordetella sp.]
MTLRSLRPSSISSRYATRLAVALALGCAVSAPAHALRLAHSRIVSAPNAPLQVLVGIADLTPDEQRSLMATLADPAAWEQAGVTPPVPLSSMTLRLEGAGAATRRNLRISSPEAAKGPAVDLLLNIGTSEGQRQVQVSIMQSAGGFPGLTSQAQVGSGSRAGRGAGSVAVRSGDTLYGIAQSNAVADATIYQMLVALWRANPNAFIQNNMNLVKAGTTLIVPDAATVRAVDPAEARRIFIQQQEAYARYRASLAGAAARGAAASAGSAAAGQVGGGQSNTTPEPSSQDRVRLSSGEPGQGESDAQAQGDAQTSVAKATQDAQQRVDQLERNVKDLNDALTAARVAEQGKSAGAQAGKGQAAGGGSGQTAGGSQAASGGQAASGSQAGGFAVPGFAGAAGSAAGSGPKAGANGAAGQSAAGANDSASKASSASQNASQGGGQPADRRVAGADTAKPGVSGDASSLGGTSGTSGTPGSSASAAGGASAQTGGSSAGQGISPAGAGSAASSSSTPANPAQAGAATDSRPAVAADSGPAATDDTDGAAKAKDAMSGLPTWLSDNLLIIMTAVLALIAFVIAWLLRRAAARREEDQDDLDEELYMSEIDQGAIDRRLDGINLDLDEPPVEADRRRPGPART